MKLTRPSKMAPPEDEWREELNSLMAKIPVPEGDRDAFARQFTVHVRMFNMFQRETATPHASSRRR